MSTEQYEYTTSDGVFGTDNLSAYLYNITTTPGPITVPDSYYLLIRDVYFVFNGILVCSGLMFNTIALLVFVSSSTLRHTTTAHYLVALAIADSTYLSGDLFRWLASKSHSFSEYTKHTDIVNQHDVLCKLMYTVRYAAMVCSSWIIVAITTERFLTIKCPLKIGRISTPVIAKLTILLITLISVALCIFPFWCLKVYPVRTTGIDVCQMNVDSLNLFKTMYWVSIRAMTLIIPSIIVTFFTIWIIWLLKERDRTQYALQAHTNINRASDRRSGLERQLTIMLVAVAVAFVVLRLPYTIVWDINQNKKTIWQPLDPWLGYDIYVAYKLTDLLAMTNYAINFFLYFMCGSTFRKQLRNLCCCKRVKPKPRKSWSIGTVSSFMSRRSSSLNGSSHKISHFTHPTDNSKQLQELVHYRDDDKHNDDVINKSYTDDKM